MDTEPLGQPFDEPPRTFWALSWFAVVAITGVGAALAADTLVEAAAHWQSGRDAVGSLLGWLPVGGAATYGAGVLGARARRRNRNNTLERPVDRVLAGVAAAWVGLALTYLPGGRSSDGVAAWQDRVAVPGAAFERAATWCLACFYVTLVWGVVLVGGMVVTRRWRPGRAPGQLVAAAILAPPYVVLLVLLVVS